METTKTNDQRRKRSIKMELERIAKEGRKEEMNFKSVLELNTPYKHFLKFKEVDRPSKRSNGQGLSRERHIFSSTV